jgi:peptidoglycan/LPS O-acetylase OafA/YrhL
MALTERNRALDALRGLAVLQIVVWHNFVPYLGPQAQRVLGLTWSGVDLFFVLSGFLIGGILLDHRTSSTYYKTFYVRRALRILPLYFVALAIFFWSQGERGASLVSYLTFTQNVAWSSRGGWGPDALGVTWSLAVEEQFYLIAPLLIALVPQRLLPGVIVALITSAPILRELAGVVYQTPHAAYMLMPCRMDSLFLGVLSAWAIRQQWFVRWRGLLLLAAPVLVSGCIWFLYARLQWDSPVMQHFGYTWLAATYACTILILVESKSRLWVRLLAPVGIGAYSIYLFDIGVDWLAGRCGLGGGFASQVLSVPILGVVAATAWIIIERPCIRFGHRWRYEYESSVPAKQPLPSLN